MRKYHDGMRMLNRKAKPFWSGKLSYQMNQANKFSGFHEEFERRGGTFFQPTVLADATTETKVSMEETFGPVVPLFRFTDEQEVIRLANRTEFGLAAHFYDGDLARIWRVATAREVGMIGVNEGDGSISVRGVK